MTMKTNDNGLDREMTATEVAEHLAWAKTVEAQNVLEADAQAVRQVARQAVLDKLGLTQDEAQLLLG